MGPVVGPPCKALAEARWRVRAAEPPAQCADRTAEVQPVRVAPTVVAPAQCADRTAEVQLVREALTVVPQAQCVDPAVVPPWAVHVITRVGTITDVPVGTRTA